MVFVILKAVASFFPHKDNLHKIKIHMKKKTVFFPYRRDVLLWAGLPTCHIYYLVFIVLAKNGSYKNQCFHGAKNALFIGMCYVDNLYGSTRQLLQDIQKPT